MTYKGPHRGYPRTYGPPRPEGAPDVFEPALKHFLHAFRKGEPTFGDALTARSWRRARGQVMDQVLAIVAGSPWAENLVLRGSLVLTSWLGELARDPGDMDWVVRPRDLALSSDWSREFFEELVPMITTGKPIGDGVQILADGVAIDDIWTYERAPGRRVVFPWTAPCLPPGVVQLDFVFGEELGAPPVETEIPRVYGGSTWVWAAGPEQSLAWKLLWLHTDWYPQGKDLYDATLLAERFKLPRELLDHTLRDAGRPFVADSPTRWKVDWASFQAEYPDVQGELAEWQARLSNALRQT